MSERIPPHQRPTIAQMRAQTNGEGWECPRCGCCDWRVVDSRQFGETRRRVRACRHCHAVIRTIETLEVSQEMPPPVERDQEGGDVIPLPRQAAG